MGTARSAVTARPLTKSRFKLALACPTQLYYSAHREYVDRNADNDFLKALADGGYQVGEMAKFLFHPDPAGAGITVESLDNAEAWTETRSRLSPAFAPGATEPVVIAEAALASGDLLVRVDILRVDPASKVLEVIEVKSKSVGQEEIAREFRNSSGFDPDWAPYLYDIAFQHLVAERVLEDLSLKTWKVLPKLVLIDRDAIVRADGLHQKFGVSGIWDEARKRHRIKVSTPAGLTADQLDLGLLRVVEVGAIVAELERQPVSSPNAPLEHCASLADFVAWASGLQRSGERFFHAVSKACKKCPYRAHPGEDGNSGVHECFKEAVRLGVLSSAQNVGDRSTALSIDLWGGRAGSQSIADRVLAIGRAALTDIVDEDIRPKTFNRTEVGLHAFERRVAQIRLAKPGSAPFELNEDALSEIDEWQWPLHMIDFETTAPAIPFFAGMRPYQTVAFQFSHHVMERDAGGGISIRHANQWISTQAGCDPSIEFVRELKRALMPEGVLEGTVFRYHNHENTVLRSLRHRIVETDVADADELVDFIDLITHSTGKGGEGHVGEKDMVDLHSLVRRGYVSAKAGGSISLKYILPAILHDVPEVAARYSVPGIYGRGLKIPSCNDWGPSGHVWLTPEAGGDPYRTLPPVFGPEYGPLDELLFRLATDDEDEGGSAITQGGVAMTAYNYTQFAQLSDFERERIQAALLRYCELDTLAMVVLVEGLLALRARGGEH